MAQIAVEMHVRRSRWFSLAMWIIAHWVVLRSFLSRFDEAHEIERATAFTMRFLTVEIRDAVAVQ